MRFIALLTDFGLRDGYVGMMKAAIATIAPAAHCIDLTHDIPPQDLWAGRFCLLNGAPYFPVGTIFLGVVDPGVGSQRRGVAIQFKEGFFVGPDNGLASGLWDIFEAIAAVTLENTKYWRDQNRKPSQTFHGRDIFAPVAAHLAQGVPICALGSSVAIADLVQLKLPPHTLTQDQLRGVIQHIDHFGNLITNIPNHAASHLGAKVFYGDRPIAHVTTYSDVQINHLCILEGSHGWLEISANQNSAQQKLNITRGESITLNRHKKKEQP
ncbi:S-adenosyl-l-methionine hydroxide adenosyltransferase family protein [[Limnothrix rosea] IAM M-220]|uniref:SAM hydrolase/SAM-dependent halogenase family protein n=1 Tax=[Limnothrix rosea] IAM M-220 TaxID=454133 RepID=UPI0009675267|nr:SAM-dependent chlorinase/fluorinase [[Limnothrix rosea] IAM M-220]OKH20050.1 hypothetical protein NIES208_00465 [[Limnothrix rosea] IAM M-220]